MTEFVHSSEREIWRKSVLSVFIYIYLVENKLFGEERIQLFMKYTDIFFPGVTLELGRLIELNLYFLPCDEIISNVRATLLLKY